MSDGATTARSPQLRIGIDFDNTIVTYDEVFLAAAKSRNLIPQDFADTKKAVRDAIRLLPDGEISWQRLQGYVYGQGIVEAVMCAGVGDFLRHCRAAGHEVFIVSHKTEFGHYDPDRVNLREAALAWMAAQGFFRPDGFGLKVENVAFETTRSEKLQRIAALACTHFIDDLEEVLTDPGFPPGVERIHYTNGEIPAGKPPYLVCPSWAEITRHLFADASTAAAELPSEVASALVNAPIDSITQVGGGRNSRVFRVESGGALYALKQYPSSQEDPRDRLGTEIEALALMEQQGFTTVPRLLGHDRSRHVALLEWIAGDPVRDVSDRDIDSAAAFLRTLHELAQHSGFPEERLASEACLSGAEIARQIRSRIARLEGLSDEAALLSFLGDETRPMLERTVADARRELARADGDFEATLPQDRRSLVPSDFGFHNSLRRPDGSLAFIDFEYFGWDDPVKLTADIILHPGTPVAAAQRARFRRAAEAIYGNDPGFAGRLSAYLPLFGLRWALILLNEFIPDRWRQRVAAGETKNWAQAKSDQLERARALLYEVGRSNEGLQRA